MLNDINIPNGIRLINTSTFVGQEIYFIWLSKSLNVKKEVIVEMDHIDRKLLSLLKKNAKMKYAELGQEVHLSAPAVHERIKKLEKSEIIHHYTIETNPKKLGLSLCAFISITLSNITLCKDAVREIEYMEEVEECFSTAGEESLFLKIRTRDTDSLEHLLVRLRSIQGVEKTLTRIVLTTHFERTALGND